MIKAKTLQLQTTDEVLLAVIERPRVQKWKTRERSSASVLSASLPRINTTLHHVASLQRVASEMQVYRLPFRSTLTGSYLLPRPVRCSSKGVLESSYNWSQCKTEEIPTSLSSLLKS